MKRLSLILFVFLLAGASFAADNKKGVGIILGEPTGLSYKQWLSGNHALDAAVAWSGTHGRLQLHADYLLHRFNMIQVEQGKLPVYFGLGAYTQLGDNGRFGARIPVGMEYYFDSSPIGIFLEVVPKMELVPDTGFDLDAAIGIRIYF